MQGTGDVTQSFEDVGHSSSARNMMNSFLIGTLEGYDADALAALQEKLRAEKKREASREDLDQGQFTLVDYLLPILILFVSVFSWYMLTFNDTSPKNWISMRIVESNHPIFRVGGNSISHGTDDLLIVLCCCAVIIHLASNRLIFRTWKN